MNLSRVYIVVVSWNNFDDTKECLDSLACIDYPNYKIIIIDNGSRDGSGKRLQKEFPQHFFIFNEENLGFAEGNNVGIKKALEDPACAYVLCLNNDTAVERSFLSELIMVAKRNEYEHFGSFQAKMIVFSQRNRIDSAGIFIKKSGYASNRGSLAPVSKYGDAEEIFGACGGAALYRREAISSLCDNDGFFFDPVFFIYAEDVDVAMRLQLRGWKSFFVASSIVFHKGSNTLGKYSVKSRMLGARNGIYVLAKNIPSSFLLIHSASVLFYRVIFIGRNFFRGFKYGIAATEGVVSGFLGWSNMRMNNYRRISKEKQFWSEWKRVVKLFK